MRIRPASPDDAEDIHRVSVASCRAAYGGVLDDETFLETVDDPSRVGALEERLAETESTESVMYVVAESEETVLGFGQVVYGEHCPEHVSSGAYLKSLYVHPDSWNEGIGSSLLSESLARLPDPITRVRVGVLSANEIGKRFYEKHGFRRVDTGTFEVEDTVYETDIYAKEFR